MKFIRKLYHQLLYDYYVGQALAGILANEMTDLDDWDRIEKEAKDLARKMIP